MKRNIVIPRQKSLAVPDIANPFVHNLKFTLLDKIQIAVMSVTIAPIRCLFIVIFLLLAWVFAAIALAFRSKEDFKKPMSGWRLSFTTPVKFFIRTMIRTIGLWIDEKGCGRATPSEAPILIAAHHSSFFDAALFFLESNPMPSPVSRAENVNVCIFSTLTMFSQPVLVDRSDPDSRANTIREIQRRGQSGGQWPQIIIFPEGTCSNRTCLISFKQGAFFPGVPVQPVCLKYPNKLDTVTWTWEGPSALAQLWYTLCQFYTKIEIEYLPVYVPSEEEKKDAKLFANNVRAVMAEALSCPVTDHTYDDIRLMGKAEKLEMPYEAGMIEFEKIHSKLGLKYDQVQELLVKFKGMKTSKSEKGKAEITYEDFGNYLHLPPSDALRQVFDLHDRDGSGTIDFREYLIGFSLISAPANDDSSIELAFQLFDEENKGYVTMEDFERMLKRAFNVNDDQVEIIFRELDTHGEGKITLDEFKSYAKEKPELASIFQTFRNLKSQGNVSENGHATDVDDVSLNTLTKRKERVSSD